MAKQKNMKRESLHKDMVSMERRQYNIKRDRDTLSHADLCSITIDGADQCAFGLPHFMTTTKQKLENSLKVKLVGLLEHGKPNTLRLFTMTEEHKTGANHIVAKEPRFLLDR